MTAASNDRVGWTRALVTLVVVFALVAASLAMLRPPSPVGISASATEFSSARAMKHLAIIAAHPHRMGSAAHDDVRAYVVRELAALDLAPEIQETSVAQLRFAERWGWPARVATVKNIVARRKGTEGGRAVLLMAHYDSRSMTPGAGDDGAGVAALLETARALGAGERSRRDVIFLVTDGEELGLLGAKAFLDEHAMAKDAAIVLNFDARGDKGSVLMFQTSENASHLIRELARTAPHAVANSLSQAVYKRMPNDSDLSEFLPTGVDAMNFGYIGGLDHYHSPTDTVANMDQGTLQHAGSYMLPLARRFADMPLPLTREGDATYFTIGPLFVRYPARADLGVAIGADAIVVLVAALALARRRARLGKLLASIGVALAAALVAGLASHGTWTFASGQHAEYGMIQAASGVLRDRWGAAFALAGVMVAIVFVAILARRLRAIELGLGAALAFGALAVPFANALPGGGWCIAWPVAGAAAPWGIALAIDRNDDDTPSTPAFVMRLVACVLPIALLVPVLATFYDAFGPDAALVISAIVALGTMLLAPAVRELVAPDRRVVALGAVVAALGVAILAWTTPAFDRFSPRPHTLFFAADLDARRSWWVSPDPAPDAWTAKVLVGAARGAMPAHMFTSGTKELASTEVPFAELEGARIEIVKDDRAASRTLDLRVVPPPYGELVVVDVTGGVVGVRAHGRDLGTKNGACVFYYSAPPASGFALSLTVQTAGKVKLRLATQRAGFPPALYGALGPRPEGLIAKPGMLPPWDEMQESDMTVTTRVFEL